MRWRFVCTRLARSYGHSKHEWESEDMPIYDYGWLKRKKKTSVYGWGLSAAGELGMQLNKKNGMMRTRSMRPLRLLEVDKHQVSDLACGRGFSVFVSRSNKRVFGCGLNTSCQLGLQSGANTDWVVNPRTLPLQLAKDEKPTFVACGRQHILVATDKAKVFALGSNAHGQCGRPVVEDEEYGKGGIVHQVNDFDGQVAQLVCGLDHSLILTDRGVVYAFGCGTDGQRGTGTYNSDWRPTQVGGDLQGEMITQIASTSDCVLAVSKTGDVFGWGNNEYKQLQTGTTEIQCSIPIRLNLGIGKVRHVAAGGSSCAAVTDSGDVYVWGYGILGQGPEVTHRSTPSLLPPPLFGATEFEPHIKVQRVYAGLMHFSAINSNGDLFVWGNNRHGLLGLGHEKDQYFPFKVWVSGLACAEECTSSFLVAVTGMSGDQSRLRI